MTDTISNLKHCFFSLLLIAGAQVVIYQNNHLKAQYDLSFGANYVYCFGERIIDLQGATYHLDHTQGFEFLGANSYKFNDSRFSAHLRLGFRYLTFAGRSENTSYSGALNKVFASGGVGYAIADKINVNAFIEAENNKEFDKFIIGSGDLFRVNLAAETQYSFTERLSAIILVSRAMTPITEAYIFTNPQYQFRVGVNYRMLP
ncbi:MAG: hypothetical protein NXI10_16880 [bacterium]|nr:hypothetical protein [bacterium]